MFIIVNKEHRTISESLSRESQQYSINSPHCTVIKQNSSHCNKNKNSSHCNTNKTVHTVTYSVIKTKTVHSVIKTKTVHTVINTISKK